jgi:predicted ATPase
MLIQSIRIDRFLSFGTSSAATPLGELNLVIGPNGSGKSNLLDAFDLLRNAPTDLHKPIRDGGGILEWLYKGPSGVRLAKLDVEVVYPDSEVNLRHELAFTERGQRFELYAETIEEQGATEASPRPYRYYLFGDGRAEIGIAGQLRALAREHLDPSQSILAQRRDPDQYPEITQLAQSYQAIRIYRDWSFGRHSPARRPQDAALPNRYLEADASNLGLILNRFQREPLVKARLLAALRKLYAGIVDYGVQIEGGSVQVFMQEGDLTIPAARLSDGTLRYLCLLAILCHPDPPPLICIEEPELGLHPDILPTIADLLKAASERCQLIVTTHSDILVDAMTDRPEDVLVAEKGPNGTRLRHLDACSLDPWLEKYRLGELWTRGDIGGTRW